MTDNKTEYKILNRVVEDKKILNHKLERIIIMTRIIFLNQ